MSIRGSIVIALICIRAFSGVINIVHDCDEVYNYWEPIHYLLYDYGMQTWEYSSKYALRSYFYLLIHCVIAYPLSLIWGSEAGKLVVFYFTRIVLASIYAFCELQIYGSLGKYEGSLNVVFLLISCIGTGNFLSASTLLPSTFAMYCSALCTAGVLAQRYTLVIICAVLGVVVGWSVSGIAMVPFALYILLAAPFIKSVITLIVGLVITILAVTLADCYFYGRLTMSVWNFVQYNVIGGGESALYGVEPWTYYFKNGFINFNIVFVAALIFPLVAALLYMVCVLNKSKLPEVLGLNFLCAVSPLYVWVAAITALPHKEERFLYVVYPQICLAGAACLITMPLLLENFLKLVSKALKSIMKAPPLLSSQSNNILRVLVIVVVLSPYLLFSISRTAAVFIYYNAPMEIYSKIPVLENVEAEKQVANVCVGLEWYRFPSSFFLPSPSYRLQFLPSDFKGLLPAHFDTTKTGTRAAPIELNNKNQEEPSLYISSFADCSYLVDYLLPAQQNSSYLNQNYLNWELVVQKPFLEASQNSLLSRVLFIPNYSEQHAVYGNYVLYKRIYAASTLIEERTDNSAADDVVD